MKNGRLSCTSIRLSCASLKCPSTNPPKSAMASRKESALLGMLSPIVMVVALLALNSILLSTRMISRSPASIEVNRSCCRSAPNSAVSWTAACWRCSATINTSASVIVPRMTIPAVNSMPCFAIISPIHPDIILHDAVIRNPLIISRRKHPSAGEQLPCRRNLLSDLQILPFLSYDLQPHPVVSRHELLQRIRNLILIKSVQRPLVVESGDNIRSHPASLQQTGRILAHREEALRDNEQEQRKAHGNNDIHAEYKTHPAFTARG